MPSDQPAVGETPRRTVVLLRGAGVPQDHNLGGRDTRNVVAARADGGVNRTKAGTTAFANPKSIVRTCQKHGRKFLGEGRTLIGLDEQPQPAPQPRHNHPNHSPPKSYPSSTLGQHARTDQAASSACFTVTERHWATPKTVATTHSDRPERSPLRRSRRPLTTPPEGDPHYVEQQMITTAYNPHARDLTSPPHATNSIAKQSMV